MAAVLLLRAGEVPGKRRDIGEVRGGEAAKEERRRAITCGKVVEERHRWRAGEDGELAEQSLCLFAE